MQSIKKLITKTARTDPPAPIKSNFNKQDISEKIIISAVNISNIIVAIRKHLIGKITTPYGQ